MGLRHGAALLLIGLSVSAMAVEPSALDRSIKDLDDQIVALSGQGRTEEALPLARQVLELRLKDGAEDPQYAASLANLALLYQSLGRYGEAEPALEQRRRRLPICRPC
jgi:tetratricopeptide (TPR) repeat protein